MILEDAPAMEPGWHGPYASLRRDPWGNPYLLRSNVSGPETFGIYSVGVNGRDEEGRGDDVSSWAGADGRFYPDSIFLSAEVWLMMIGVLGLPAMLLAYYILGRRIVRRLASAGERLPDQSQ